MSERLTLCVLSSCIARWRRSTLDASLTETRDVLLIILRRRQQQQQRERRRALKAGAEGKAGVTGRHDEAMCRVPCTGTVTKIMAQCTDMRERERETKRDGEWLVSGRREQSVALAAPVIVLLPLCPLFQQQQQQQHWTEARSRLSFEGKK